jgi:uncharacterized repeat protein (TIGR01451 family)
MPCTGSSGVGRARAGERGWRAPPDPCGIRHGHYIGRIGRVGIAVVVLALFPGTALAGPVLNTNDVGPGSLRQAIADAVAGDTVDVPAGIYSLTSGELVVNKSLTITGQGAGVTIVRAGAVQRVFHTEGAGHAIAINAMTIRDGLAQTPSVTQGGGISNENATLSLTGVVLTNDIADASGTGSSGGGLAYGGAIYNTGTVSLTDSSLTADIAEARGASGQVGGLAYGGGIYSLGAGSVTLTRTSVTGGTADARGGPGGTSGGLGGIAEGAGVYVNLTSPAALTISGAALSANTGLASAGPGSLGGVAQGGGLYAIGSGNVSLTDVALDGNVDDALGGLGGTSTQFGGAAAGAGADIALSGAATLVFAGGSARSNSVDASGGPGSSGGNASGGGLAVADGATISGVEISGNTLVSRGGNGPSNVSQSGGVAQGAGLAETTANPQAFSLSASDVSQNGSDVSSGPGGGGGTAHGGGVYFSGAGTQNATFTNVTIAGNAITAGGGTATGGGLYSATTAVDPVETLLLSSTISGNSALATTTVTGGNIQAAGKLHVQDTIVSAGSADAASGNCAGPIASDGHNIDSADQCTFHGIGDLVDTDPQLGTLAANGGPTLTEAISNASPAVDAGGGCPATDQRGIARPQGTACDIGAFEAEAADLSLTDAASATKVAVGTTVTYTLTATNLGPSTGHATTVSDALPATLRLVSAQPSVDTCAAGPPLVCSIGELAAGADATVTIVARALRPGPVTNTALAATTTLDTDAANNTAGASLTVTALAIGGAHLTPNRFRLGSLLAKLSRAPAHKTATGTKLAFTLPAPATVRLTFALATSGRKVAKSCAKRSRHNTNRAHCTRYVAAGSFSVAGRGGVNNVRFQGRLSAHKTLKPGSYRITMTAADPFGNRAAAVTLHFTLLARAKH